MHIITLHESTGTKKPKEFNKTIRIHYKKLSRGHEELYVTKESFDLLKEWMQGKAIGDFLEPNNNLIKFRYWAKCETLEWRPDEIEPEERQFWEEGEKIIFSTIVEEIVFVEHIHKVGEADA